MHNLQAPFRGLEENVVVTDIVLALAIFFIGLPLAAGLLFMLVRVWWLIPLIAVFGFIALQGPQL